MPGAEIQIYTKQWCPFCAKAKALLRAKGLEWDELDVTFDERLQQEMVARSGRRSVPEIFLGGELVGGYDELARLNATGELDRRLPPDVRSSWSTAPLPGPSAGPTIPRCAPCARRASMPPATDPSAMRTRSASIRRSGSAWKRRSPT